MSSIGVVVDRNNCHSSVVLEVFAQHSYSWDHTAELALGDKLLEEVPDNDAVVDTEREVADIDLKQLRLFITTNKA